jgi:hypothetical protein
VVGRDPGQGEPGTDHEQGEAEDDEEATAHASDRSPGVRRSAVPLGKS